MCEIRIGFVFLLFLLGCSGEANQPARPIQKSYAQIPSAEREPPANFSATVIRVTDGDTITVSTLPYREIIIQLNGIDAPERFQAYSSKAKVALTTWISGKKATVKNHGQDRYGRLIGDIEVDGRNINFELVRNGWAWHFKKYSDDPELAQAEIDARREKKGLWADPNEPLAPWDYRNRRAKEVSPGRWEFGVWKDDSEETPKGFGGPKK